MRIYLCINKMKGQTLKTMIMNTNDTLTRISAMFSSEDAFMTLIDLVDDLDLELKNIVMA